MIPGIDVFGPGVGWIAGALIKVTLLLIVAAILTVLLRRASAAARHLVWSAAIVTVLAVPVMTALLPWRLPVVRVATPAETPRTALSRSEAPTEGGPATTVSPPAAPVAPAVPAAPAAPAAPAVNAASAASAVSALWLAGALLLLLRLGVGAGFLARVTRRATALTSPDWTRPLLEAADRLELARAPRLLMSARLPMPYATGFFRPTIVLPESAAEWDDRRRRAVLCHELAHLRRMDLVLNGVAQIACALWWFHPLVWVAARKLRTESERACDDLVLGVGTRASEYADHLLHIVCGALRARTPAVALPMAQQHEFEGRMLAILDRDARRDQPSRRHAVVLSALAVGIVLPVAALGIGTASPPVVTPTPMTETRIEVPDGASREDADEPGLGADSIARVESATAARPAAPPVLDSGEDAAQDSTMSRVVAALLKALEDPVAEVRRGAALALGKREAAGAVRALSARLSTDADAEVREASAWALGQIQSRESTPALGTAADRDSSEEVRGTAVWALGQIQDPQSIPALTAVLADPSAEVRGRAAWALGTIGVRPAPDALRAALRDGSAEVRYRAAWALGQIEDTTAVPALVAAFDDTDPDVRKAAFWAAAQMPGEGAQPALLKALEHQDPEIRVMAARALGGSGSGPWPWPWPWPR